MAFSTNRYMQGINTKIDLLARATVQNMDSLTALKHEVTKYERHIHQVRKQQFSRDYHTMT